MNLYISSDETAGFYEPVKIKIVKKLNKSNNLFFRKEGAHINSDKVVLLSLNDDLTISKKMSSDFIIFPRYMFESLNSFPKTINIFLPIDNNYNNVSKKNLFFYGIGKIYTKPDRIG